MVSFNSFPYNNIKYLYYIITRGSSLRSNTSHILAYVSCHQTFNATV